MQVQLSQIPYAEVPDVNVEQQIVESILPSSDSRRCFPVCSLSIGKTLEERGIHIDQQVISDFYSSRIRFFAYCIGIIMLDIIFFFILVYRIKHDKDIVTISNGVLTACLVIAGSLSVIIGSCEQANNDYCKFYEEII